MRPKKSQFGWGAYYVLSLFGRKSSYGCHRYSRSVSDLVTPGPKVPVSFVAGDESCWRIVRRDRSDVARIFINDD